MPTILKEGKKNIQTETHYKYTCKRCECEFEFQLSDFKVTYISDRVQCIKLINVRCPYCGCHHVMTGTDLDQLPKEVREAEHKWKEEYDDTKEYWWPKLNTGDDFFK